MFSLTTILRLNASSCILFGLLFIAIPNATSTFLSSTIPAPSLIILLIGIVLICNGLHLLWASSKPAPSKALIQYFSSGDFIWVAATVLLIVFEIWITNIPGIITASVVAICVGLLGALQLISYRKLN